MEPENGPVKAYFEPVVCVSELVNWQCEVPELQMSIKLSLGFLGLTEASSLLNLPLLAFGSSDPCNELSL